MGPTASKKPLRAKCLGFGSILKSTIARMGAGCPYFWRYSLLNGARPLRDPNRRCALTGPLATSFSDFDAVVFFSLAAFPNPTGWYILPRSPIFFRTFLRWFRVARPFIVWLTWWLVAKPQCDHKKNLKKKEYWPCGGAATVVPPLDISLIWPSSPYMGGRHMSPARLHSRRGGSSI